MTQEANGVEVLDEGESLPPSPSPGLRPNRGLRSLFFSSPETEEDSPTASPEGASPPAADGAGSASAGDWPTDELPDLDESDPSSSPSGSGEGPLKPLTKAALKATTRKGVLIASSMAHRFAARTDLERRAGVYLADEQDQEHIGDPLASILSRRGGVVGGKVSPDAADALSALMGLANYVGKQVALAMQIREVEAEQQPHAGPVDVA